MPSRAVNRILWVSILLVIAVLFIKTRDNLDAFYIGIGSLDVRAEPDQGTVYLRWRGKIAAPMESRIAEAFQRHRAEARTFVLTLSSPGGALDHGAQVIRLLREMSQSHRVETVVESGRRCASMCVPVYLSGQRRTAAEDANFMFHEVSFRETLAKEDLNVPESAKVSATDSLFKKYFASAGVPDAWIRQVRAEMSGGNDVWKTGRELVDENAGIVQSVF